jgi:Cu(I)/Ag(I) efflux system membrane fusion protein
MTSHTEARTVSMRTLLIVASVSAALGAGAFAAHERFHRASEAGPLKAEAKQRWQCPMHPSMVQDHPGDCPICGMKLVPTEGSPAVAPTGPGERKILFYRSPHDPKKTSPVPGKDEMGMDLVPVYADEAEGGSEAGAPGLATVRIDPARQQLIGLRTATVERGPVGRVWRTAGRVAVDETRVRHVNVKVSGFVEKVFIDFTGKPVRRGEPLFTIYSPELYAAQEEYLLALRTRRTLAEGGAFAKNGDELLDAARRKLELWDIPREEVERLEQSGRPSRALTLTSPISGVVVKKDVVDGMRLEAGAMPYEIVDLSEVWVLADVYETEIRRVKLGMPATLELKAYPDRRFDGRVVFVDPVLNASTRTVKVRLTFPNSDGALRPEMFGDVELSGPPRQALRIPADAVIHSGTEEVVFVALGDGKLAPKMVKLGESDDANVEVVEGLGLGDHVVTRANFLVDSESRLRASLAALAGAAADKPAPPPPPTHEGHGGKER